MDKPSQAESLPYSSRWHRHRIGSTIERHDPERVVYPPRMDATLSGSNELWACRNPWAALRLPTAIVDDPFGVEFRSGHVYPWAASAFGGLAHGYCRQPLRGGMNDGGGRRCPWGALRLPTAAIVQPSRLNRFGTPQLHAGRAATALCRRRWW